MELRHFLHFLRPDPPARPSVPHHVNDTLRRDRFCLDRAGAVGEFWVVGADVADASQSRAARVNGITNPTGNTHR